MTIMGALALTGLILCIPGGMFASYAVMVNDERPQWWMTALVITGVAFLLAAVWVAVFI